MLSRNSKYMFFLSLSSTKDEGSQGMRTSMSRISTALHGVIVTDWSLDTRCAFRAGSPEACSVILFVCLQRLRAAKAAIFCGSGSWFLSSTKDEGCQGMRTSMSRISMASHGVIVTDWSLDTRCAFQAGVPNSCSIILFVCLHVCAWLMLRFSVQVGAGFSVLGCADIAQGRAPFAAGSPSIAPKRRFFVLLPAQIGRAHV